MYCCNSFSRYIETAKIVPMTSDCVIGKLKISYHVGEFLLNLLVIMGKQFTSLAFKAFQSYGFKHTTSSLHYPKANGDAESVVKIAK